MGNLWKSKKILGTDTFGDAESLKVNIGMKPEYFLLNLMDDQLEKAHGQLILYIVTGVRLLYAHK